jgi:NodT family efflux transporter outer membrane factor (OMF) lipoprotein
MMLVRTRIRFAMAPALCRRALFVLPFLVTGCMVGPDYTKPSAPTPAAYKEAGDWKQAEPKDDAIRGKWWEVYHDNRLNALEEQVNISNQNVLQAEAQFREAASAVKVARAGLFPSVTANPSYTESQASQNLVTHSNTANSQHVGAVTQGVYDLPLEATYMADVWGAVRRGVEADSTAAQASFADLENARLSYQATLAQDYFSLCGLDAEQQILETTVTSYQKYLDLTTNRYNSGIASKGDVALARTQLDTARAQLIDVGVQRAQFEHAIATLTGKPASEFSLGKKPLAATPPRIPVAMPSILLERRPDIAAAERLVASANASIGVAVAAYYPSITLSGSTGLQAIQLSELFSGPSFFWSVGPVLAQTLFDAGKIHGQVQEAQANYDATVAAYRETVLTAFQQVEDDLSGLRILEDEASVQDEAVDAARQSLDIETNQYQAGTVDYLTVITAQTTELNDELSSVSIRTRRMTTSVLLIEAVGGGWDASVLPTPHQVSNEPQAQEQITKGKK